MADKETGAPGKPGTAAPFFQGDARFRGMFEHSPVGMALVTPSFHFIEVNEAFARMLGYSREELVGMTFQDVTWPEDRPVGAQLVKRVLDGVTPTFQLEKRYTRKDGTFVWGLVGATLVRDDAGAPWYMVAQITDVTERKIAEERLGRERRNFESIFHAAPVGMVLFDARARIHSVNAALAVMAMREPSQVRGWSFGLAFGCIHCDEDPRGCGFSPSCAECPARQAIVRVLEKGDAVFGIVMRSTVRADGLHEPRVLSMNAVPIEVDDARHGAFTIEDVTSRERADAAVRESEERFFTAFQTAPFAITITKPDEKGTFVAVNDAFIALSGYSREEALGSSALDLGVWADLDHRKQIMEALARGDTVDDQAVDFRRKDGRVLTCRFAVRIVRVGSAPLLLATIADVTESKSAERQIREQLHELERWHRVMLNREDRVQELKREVNGLCERLGESPRYPSQLADGTGEPSP